MYAIFYEVFFCLSDILGKKYLNKYMDSVYIFCGKFGIISLIPFLIYDSIAFMCKADEKYHGIILLLLQFKSLYFDIILSILFNIFYTIGLWLTIYFFSPCHFIILITLGDFFDIICKLYIFKSKKSIIDEYKNYKNYQIITFYILYPILIFAVLVFNEIIILTFCKLNYNTKIYIMKREKSESSDKFSDYSFEDKICDNEDNENLFSN
jgi:hypothetical protein